MTQSKKDLLHNIMLLVLTICLFCMNFIRIFDNNFWADECYTIRITNYPFGEMLQTTAADVHPPLYYALLMLVKGIFGASPYLYHFVSMIPYIGILIFCFFFVKRHYSYGTAAILIVLASLSENSIKYNVEVRMYSLAAFFTLLAYFFFLELLEKESLANYIIFAIASLGVAYTQYLAVLPIAVLYLALLVFSILHKRKIKNIVFLYLGTVLAYIPWLIPFITTYLRKVEGGGQSWINEEPNLLWCFIYFFNTRNKYYSFLLLMITVCALAIVLIQERIKHESFAARNFGLVMGIIASAFPVFVLKILSRLVAPMLVTRYYFPGTLIFWAVLAIASFNPKWKIYPVLQLALTALILVVCTRTYITIYSAEKISAQKCDATVSTLSPMIGKEDKLLTNNGQLGWTVLSYYFPETPHKITTDIHKITYDSSSRCWCVWSKPLSAEESDYLESIGYSEELIVEDGIIGDAPVYIYRLNEN